MKKFLFITFILVLISFFAPYKAQAVDITAGATSWFVVSEQYYTQGKGAQGVLHDSLVKSIPALLYGPTLAVKLNNDFNLTFVFLYGNFITEKDSGNYKWKSRFSRSDSDLALNYRLNNFLKLFAGFKYLAYGITPSSTDLMSFQLVNRIDGHSSYGSGLGLSCTYPLMGNLFVLGTLSGLYLFGADKISVGDINGNYSQSSNVSYNEYGVNSTLSLAYYIAPASTVISLGSRLQYLKADYKKNPIYLDSVEFLSYGVTLTATYTFSI
jgi:hypothetical protein